MNFLRSLIIAGLAIVGARDLGAEDSKENPGWLITAECRMVVIPQKEALPLVMQLNDEATVDAAWEKIGKMIEAGTAELVGDLILKGGHDQKLTAQSVEAVRYPSEFEPPQLPPKIPEGASAEILKAWPHIGITPTAYETRNVGQMIEVHALTAKDGEWIDVTISPEHVRLLKWTKFDAGRMSNGERLSVEQPNFHTMKNTMEMQIKNGQRILAGVFKHPDESKSLEFFLFTAKAEKRGVTK